MSINLPGLAIYVLDMNDTKRSNDKKQIATKDPVLM